MPRTPTLLAAMLLLVPGVATAQQAMPRVAPEVVGLSDAELHEATELLNRYVAEQKIAGAVAAVVRKGRVAYLEAVGVQDLSTRSPMTEGSIFRIYSMAKPITAVAVMMLHEEGRFDLDDPVSLYLPEFAHVRVTDSPEAAPRVPTRPITVRDLLLHTSGLNHRTSALYQREEVRSRSIPMSRFVSNLVRVPLMEDPGTRFRYSEGTTVLGRLVEIWSGQPLEAFLKERLFLPLGMLDTEFVVRPDQLSRWTTVYAPAPEGRLRPIELEEVPFTERPALLEGAVGLVSTVPDYLRFSQMLLDRGTLDGVQILSEPTVDLITVNALSPDLLQTRGNGDVGWGLGNVAVVVDPTSLDYPASAGEFGWNGSAGTVFYIDREKEMITILMTQSSPGNPEGLRQRFKTLVEQALVAGSR